MGDFWNKFSRSMDAVFSGMASDIENWGAADTTFPVGAVPQSSTRYSIHKNADGVTILVEVPGYGPENVTLGFHNQVITVHCRNSVVWGSMRLSETFRVSPHVKADDISASVKNGLLSITVKRETQPDVPRYNVKVTGG